MDKRDYIHEMRIRKVVFENESGFKNWLFEYACRTAEWEGINPTKATTYLVMVQQRKLKEMLVGIDKIYKQFPNYTSIIIPELDTGLIDVIVRNEHGGGKPLDKRI